MDFAGIELLMNPALILFVIFSIIALIKRFFILWIGTLIACAIVATIFIVISVTLLQLVGETDFIRFYITSNYIITGSIKLTFRDIILSFYLVISYFATYYGHLLKVERYLQRSILWIPRRRSCQYEMENTLEKYSVDKEKIK